MEQKYAIRKLVRGEDGVMRLEYVDAMTGQVLSNLQGYTVYSIHEAQQRGITAPSTSTGVTDAVTDNTDNKETTAKKVVSQATDSNDTSTVGGEGSFRGLLDHSPGNNYGYIDTPNWLSLAGFLPVVGGVAKWADRGIGASNTVSANKAREGMGLDPLGGIRSLGNILGMRDESVAANVKIGEKPYSVGFEALNAKGQTTLTPNEARNRALIAGQPLTEMKPSESRAWEKETGATNKGFLSNLFGNLFGRNETPTREAGYDSMYSYYNPDYSFVGGGSDSPVTYTKSAYVPDSSVPIPTSRPSSSTPSSSIDSFTSTGTGSGALDGWGGWI